MRKMTMRERMLAVLQGREHARPRSCRTRGPVRSDAIPHGCAHLPDAAGVIRLRRAARLRPDPAARPPRDRHGRGAASPLWRRILADILEAPVEYHPAASGALGIAFLAAYATGHIGGFSAMRDKWLAQPEVVTPDSIAAKMYRRLYKLYCCLDDALGPAYAMLGDAAP